jgi:MFS family permease
MIVLVGFLIENAMEGWSALHIERTLGGNPAEGALGPTVLGLTMGIGRLAGQIVAGRWREGPVLVAASVLSCAGLLIAATAGSTRVAYAGFGLSGVGVSVIAPMALALVGRSVPARMRTVAIARASVIGFMGFFLGPTLVGGLSELAGLRIALGSAALVLLAVPPMLALMRSGSSDPRSPRAPEERLDRGF